MQTPDSKSVDVVGLGNALMDFLVEVDEATLNTTELAKGGMHLVDEAKAQQLLKHLSETKFLTTPGGAAANTIKAVAALGGETVLFAQVGEDDHGSAYIEAIELHGVTSRIGRHASTTGHALTFITPDAERTFSVHLGAALQLGKADILEEDIANAKVLHLEAFQFEGPTKETVFHAIEIAKKHGTLISIDLADSLLIERNFDLFTEIVACDVDILFCNEDEGKTFTGKAEHEALAVMGSLAQTAVLKLGVKGSLISVDGESTHIDAYPTEAVDTTGAGDTYAAGFLYGYTQGWDTKTSGQLGALLASKVISKIGVDIMDIDVEGILRKIKGDG